jgi:hypothetical protein
LLSIIHKILQYHRYLSSMQVEYEEPSVVAEASTQQPQPVAVAADEDEEEEEEEEAEEGE